jgi:hypothetical protein
VLVVQTEVKATTESSASNSGAETTIHTIAEKENTNASQ